MGIIVNKTKLDASGHATDGIGEHEDDEQTANEFGRGRDQRPAERY